MGYLYIFLTIALTVLGQLLLKWRMDIFGGFPEGTYEKLLFLFKVLTDFWVIISFASAFFASLTWIAALTKFELSFAYPFMSLSFVFVFLLSWYFFEETFTWSKVIGLCLIVAGVTISAKNF
jgi:multidrug transporter EmrE-like cation transporter